VQIDPNEADDRATLDELARLCIERAQRTGHRRGSEHPNARLTEAKVRQLRYIWAAADAALREGGKPALSLASPLGETERRLLRSLGKMFGVNYQTIRLAIRRATWAHVV
jgi:hypothetical protein